MTPHRLAREARTERRRCTIAAVIGSACVLGLAITGCRTDTPAAPVAAHAAPAAVTAPGPTVPAVPVGPTHAEFAKQLAKVCRDATAKTDEGESPEALEASADALDEFVDNLKRLDAPAKDRPALGRYIRATEQATSVARQSAAATRNGDDDALLGLYGTATTAAQGIVQAAAELGAGKDCAA